MLHSTPKTWKRSPKACGFRGVLASSGCYSPGVPLPPSPGVFSHICQWEPARPVPISLLLRGVLGIPRAIAPEDLLGTLSRSQHRGACPELAVEAVSAHVGTGACPVGGWAPHRTLPTVGMGVPYIELKPGPRMGLKRAELGNLYGGWGALSCLPSSRAETLTLGPRLVPCPCGFLSSMGWWLSGLDTQS